MPSIRSQSYEQRSSNHTNAAAKALLETMARKSTNLCLSIDVTKKASLLHIANAIGPSICLLKTHIDTVEDFDHDLIEQLQKLANTHDFLLFEDRKFADIGAYAHTLLIFFLLTGHLPLMNGLSRRQYCRSPICFWTF